MTATAPMSTKRAQTQDRLMDAATALFAEKGVLAASVEEICERAGFTRGAFYSNFESKDELLLAVVQRKREAILKAATDAIDSIPDEPIEPQTLDEIIVSIAPVTLGSGKPLLPRRLDLRLAETSRNRAFVCARYQVLGRLREDR